MILLIQINDKIYTCNYEITNFIELLLSGDYDMFCYETGNLQVYDYKITILNEINKRIINIFSDNIDIVVSIFYDDNLVTIEGNSKNQGIEMSIISKIIDYFYKQEFSVMWGDLR